MSNNASIYETLSAQKEIIEKDPSLKELFHKFEIAAKNEQDRSKLTPAQFAMEPVHPVVKARYDALQCEIIERAIAKEKEGK